jgi:hypothetical protein
MNFILNEKKMKIAISDFKFQIHRNFIISLLFPLGFVIPLGFHFFRVAWVVLKLTKRS